MLNYSKFTKEELIEAIELCKNNYELDNRLIDVYERKSYYYIDKSELLYKEFSEAMRNQNFERANELQRQIKYIDKQLERLDKAIQ